MYPLPVSDQVMKPDNARDSMKAMRQAAKQMSLHALRYELMEANRLSYGYQGTPIAQRYEDRFNYLLKLYNQRVQKEQAKARNGEAA